MCNVMKLYFLVDIAVVVFVLVVVVFVYTNTAITYSNISREGGCWLI